MVRIDPAVGQRFRQLRKSRGKSLAEVAEATQISSSFLSLFENGKNDITFGRLSRLIDYFSIGINDLIPDPEPAESVIVHREARRPITSTSERAAIQILTHGAKNTMFPVLLTIDPGGAVLEGGTYAGAEMFVLVLRGNVELTQHGQTPVVLREGDAAFCALDPLPSPRLRNIGRGLAEMLLVTTPAPW